MTIKEIKEELTKLGVEYDSALTKPELKKILKDAKEKLVEAVVDPEPAVKVDRSPKQRQTRKYKKKEPPLPYASLVECNAMAREVAKGLKQQAFEKKVQEARELIALVDK